MAPTTGVLALIDDVALRDDVDRVSAAAGLPVVHASEPSSRMVWTGAAAVLLDVAAARRCAELALPRRGRVVLVSGAAPVPDEWQAAIAVGAQQVLTLPAQDGDLMTELAHAAETADDDSHRGAVIAVIAGRGGAGASVFAAALAKAAAGSSDALLVDADPFGGGIDLVVGAESEAGLRWPDLVLQGGRVTYTALRDALPRRHGVCTLSSGRDGGDIDAGPVGAVIDAGSRGGATVVCDVPRRPTPAAETALATADLVVVMVPADVRSCAAAAVVARWVASVNPNAGVVVRGPAPGGLSTSDVGEIAGLPPLASMRPQPGLDTMLEHGGLRLRRRSPLATAARRVLGVARRHPAVSAA